MCSSLVIVAESSRARIFEMENPGKPLTEIMDMVHPGSRAHAHDLTADLPGRSFDSRGQARHAMVDAMDVKEQQALLFAEQLAAYINTECRNNNLERLYIVAAPHFLGQLRKKLDAAAKHHIARQLNKNLVTMDEATIRKHLF
ncbi:MAG: hypothetical protein A3J35_02995 [Gammaproteobacteria bacterium RIFCSPLOWO2_02_FULL_52_10]|nr:MAG: hypothetical protein A3J35_02995 [Gammaproteobacteria bacterium RIFCSPLOWO2_02_FULL_52_10]